MYLDAVIVLLKCKRDLHRLGKYLGAVRPAIAVIRLAQMWFMQGW